jgi:alkylation response protein AidB-like acyl-CoA dehydrogenase
MEWDETQHFPEELRPKLAELGLMGVIFPEEYGGAGMGYIEYATIIEELGALTARSDFRSRRTIRFARIIFICSARRAKTEISRAARAGRKFRRVGFDRSASRFGRFGTRTTAIRSNGGWKVNGSKNFITHAIACNTLVAVAVTDKEKGNKGISAFIFDKSMEGFRRTKRKTNSECARRKRLRSF